jgi:regulator of protease activity HflC (stomatin/prohibitin superfamily)
MDPLVTFGAIVIGVFILFIIIVRSVRLTLQYERLVILSLGVYRATRGPGLVFVMPWEQATKVDLRERFLEIPRQTAISKDNAPINVDFLVYYRVVNAPDSVLKIDNAVRASLNIAATTLRSVIGDISLDDVLAKREQINDVLRIKLDEVTENWGLKVTRVEIREIEPPREVQEAMNRQMTAERERRATVTRAEGERESAIMIAEGQRQSSILKAQGDKESAVLKAEGERQAQLLRAEGFAASLEAISKEAKGLDEQTMALQYLDTLRSVGTSASTKFVLPMELTTLMAKFSGTMAAKNGSSADNQDQSAG